jgi:hypothetical protein
MKNNNLPRQQPPSTPLAEILFLLGNGARKLIGCVVLMYEFYR